MELLRFGSFEVDLERRSLFQGSKVIKVGGRAFDLLAYFLLKPGKLISKSELIAAVWPSTIVDEGALRVQLVALRKALLDDNRVDYIESVPGRGYQFVQSVTRSKSSHSLQAASANKALTLPLFGADLIGREQFVQGILRQLNVGRLVTITGVGGIGKTSVAIEVARKVSASFETTIFLDLASLTATASIASYLASILGLSLYAEDPFPGIVNALAGRRTFLIFDNCEHVIESSAVLVERLLEADLNVTMLATSREALRINYEQICYLSGLETPPAGFAVTDASNYSALALFNARTAMSSDTSNGFELQDIALAGEIVSRLDGIPLAIELASSRVASLGLAGVLESLANPIKLLRKGRRTAPQRQQTLRATLDWSYSLLTGHEAALLAHLSVFAGSFDDVAAESVAPAELDHDSFQEAWVGLIAKSLISVSRSDQTFRLLEVTRAFAREKLAESEFSMRCHQAHAKWARVQVGLAASDWAALETSMWLKRHANSIHDVRIAIAWALEGSHFALGLELVASSHILWTQLGLMSEQLRILEMAVGRLGTTNTVPPIIETRLRASYAAALFHLKSLDADEEAFDQFTRATQSADASGDSTEIVRTHSGICAILTTHGRYLEAIEIADRLDAKLGSAAHNAVSRIYAMNEHFVGNIVRSDAMCRRALEAGSMNIRTTGTSGAGYDQKLLALLVMAKNAWLRGETQTSMNISSEAVAEALNIQDPISTCLVLAVSACPLLFGMGEISAARDHLDMLGEIAARHSLARWTEWAVGYELLTKLDAVTERHFRNDFANSTPGPRLEGIVVAAGTRVGDGLTDYALSSRPGWCLAELLRVKGEIIKHTDIDEARSLFQQASELANRQGARLWSLRAAASLLDISRPEEILNSRRRLEKIAAEFPERLAPVERKLCERHDILSSAMIEDA